MHRFIITGHSTSCSIMSINVSQYVVAPSFAAAIEAFYKDSNNNRIIVDSIRRVK